MRLALPLLLAAAAPGALAAVTATVQITGLRFEVRDLRPDDGRAPSHSFQGLAYGLLLADLQTWGRPIDGDLVEPGGIGSWRIDLRRPWGRSFSSVVATPDQVTVRVGGAGRDEPVRGAFDTNAFTWVEGTIGAYTAVTMRADYVIDIQADPVPGASRRESVTASVSAFETQVLRTVYANPALGPQHLRLEGSLSDVLANDSVEGLPYSQRLFAEAQGRQFLPIPEPAAPALMLGGLGVLGAWVRRRRGAA